MQAQHENNYWEVNSEYLLLPEFSQFYTKDKSKAKEESSRIMWAINYAFNPDSKFFHYPNKLEVLSKDFIKIPKFKWDNVTNIIDIFKNLVLSDAEKSLVNWSEIMVLRDNSLKDLYRNAIQAGDTDELVKLDKMLSNTPKMFEDYKKIKRDYEEEKTIKKGKSIASLSDSGEL